MIVHLCFSRIFEKRFSFILTSVLKKIKNVPLLRAVVVAPRWVDLRLRNNNVKNDDSRPDSRGNKFVTNISELELIATTAVVASWFLIPVLEVVDTIKHGTCR